MTTLQVVFASGDCNDMVMEVIRRTLSVLALMSLLLQAAFGAVSPVAVLCISSHGCIDHGGDGAIVSEPITACDENRCCARPAPARTDALNDVQNKAQDESLAEDHGDEDVVRIALATPCDEGCADCVDVALPSDVPVHDVRGDALELLLSMTAQGADQSPVFAVPVSEVVPAGTGPPEVRCFADRAIIRTTRLLI